SQAVEGEGSRQTTESQYTPTTASPSHSSGPTTLVVDEDVHEERGDNVERAATTATSLATEQGSGNINRTQSTAIPNVPFPQGIGLGGSSRCQETMGDTIAQTRSERVSTPSYDLPLLGVNTPGSDEERIELKELMDMYTKLSDRVLDLDNVKDAQALEIKKLKKRSLGDQEDSSKQERNEIDQDEGISWFQEDAETQGRYGHDISTSEVTIASVPSDMDVSAASPIRPVYDSITDDITLAKTLMKIKTQRLQAELDKEARLEREREEEASNATLIKEWDSIESRIDDDA
ncbi:hypothetical protein Tco_0981081, partial [Tanacetum coccineum]